MRKESTTTSSTLKTTRDSLREEEGKRVGIWIRVSTEDQARGESAAEDSPHAPANFLDQHEINAEC